MLMPSIFGENFLDDFFAAPFGGYSDSEIMKTDIEDKDGGYELTMNMPGYKKEDVKAELKDGYMTISAEKKSEDSEKDEKSGKYLRRERYYGSCSRSFYVGEDITEEDIKAKFEDGILKIAVPKKEPQPAVDQTKTIAIEG